MATYLLTWNPERFKWTDLPETAARVQQGERVDGTWSTGHTKRIQPGDRLFLLRQGKEPRGIVASATAASTVQELEHFDPELAAQGKTSLNVDFVYDALVDPDGDPERVLKLDRLRGGALAGVKWSTQASGISIPDDAAEELEGLWAANLGDQPQTWILRGSAEAAAQGEFDPTNEADARRHVGRQIAARQGQPEFRKSLLSAYRGCCAISGCAVDCVLEAAHIMPYRGAHTNHVQNGLLLRADLHTLFDLHLLTIDTATWQVRVAPQIAGTEYAVLDGKPLRRPDDERCHPSKEALDRHRQPQIIDQEDGSH